MKKIKIVFVEYQLICGGAEQALFDLVNLLDRERFEASVFVQSPGGSWEKKFQDAGIPVIHDYDCRKPTFNPVRKLGNFVKKCRVARANRQGGRGLLEVCLPEQPDIVVSYSAWMQDEIAFVKNAKSVKYIHGDPGTNPVYRKEAVEEQEILRRYDRIVCVSQAAWDSFRKLSGLEHQTELHYNPLNSDNVRALSRQPVSLPEDVPLVCAVGRLAEEKGFAEEFALYTAVERLAPEVIASKRRIYKGVCANVDFYSGFVYRMLDLPEELFTPIFAISRIAGWSAHRLEEIVGNSKIIRPSYKNVLPDMPYIPLSER